MTEQTSRIVLVTGASSGMGAAVCRRLAEPGVSLLMHARGAGEEASLLEAQAEKARAAGAEVETALAPLDEPGVGTDLVARALDRFGGLDQIVSNAGFADRRVLGEVEREVLDRSFNVMTGAFFDLVTAAREALTQSSWGRVVAISSFVVHTFVDGRLFPTTAAAKAGIEALAKSFAAQVAASGTTVNCVAPGYTRKDATGHSALSEDAWTRAAQITPPATHRDARRYRGDGQLSARSRRPPYHRTGDPCRRRVDLGLNAEKPTCPRSR